MKKYTYLTLDCSTLIAETISHLDATQNLEDDEHRLNALHWVGSKSELEASIPSINTTLSQFDVRGFGNYTVNSTFAWNISWGDNFLLIPLMECEGTVVKLFSLTPGAILTPEGFYEDEDCTLTDTIPLTGPLFVGKNNVFTLEQQGSNEKLSDVLVVFINGDTDSYLAE